MTNLIRRTTEPTTDEILAALRLRCEAWGIAQSEVDRLAAQIAAQRTARGETIH